MKMKTLGAFALTLALSTHAAGDERGGPPRVRSRDDGVVRGNVVPET